MPSVGYIAGQPGDPNFDPNQVPYADASHDPMKPDDYHIYSPYGPGVVAINDPLFNGTRQVPVVTSIVQVQKTSPIVLIVLGVLSYYVFFRKGF